MEYYKTDITSNYYIDKILNFLYKYNKSSNGEYVFYDNDEKSLLENVNYVEGYKDEIIGILKTISQEDIQNILLSAILKRYRALSEKSFPKHYFAKSWLEFPHFYQLEKGIQTEFRKSFNNTGTGNILSELNYILMNSIKLTDEEVNNIVKEMSGNIFLTNLYSGSDGLLIPVIQLVKNGEDNEASYTNIPLSTLSYYGDELNLFEQIVELTNLYEVIND